MNIGFLHNDRWPLKDAPSIQSFEIAKRLSQKNKLYSSKYCPFPFVNKIYKGRKSIPSFVKKIDQLFLIIDGEYKFEKFSILSLLKKKKIPVIWLINAPLEERLLFGYKKNLNFLLQKKLRLFFANFVDLAVCMSNEIETYARNELGINNTVVIPNGVDHNLFNPFYNTDSIFKKNGDYFNVVWAGNGEFKWHALDVVSKVARKMEKLDKKVRFIIITNGTWQNFYDQKNVCVVNSIEYRFVPEFLRLADLFLCLYHPQLPDQNMFYGSPMKLFEYMSMGKPVLGNNIGQVGEVVRDGVNGFLVENLRVDGIVKKIIYAKKNWSISKRLGKKARLDIVNKYNWDNMVSKIEIEMAKLVNN